MKWIVCDWGVSNFYGPFASVTEAKDWVDGIQGRQPDGTETDKNEVSIEQLLEPELT